LASWEEGETAGEKLVVGGGWAKGELRGDCRLGEIFWKEFWDILLREDLFCFISGKKGSRERVLGQPQAKRSFLMYGKEEEENDVRKAG